MSGRTGRRGSARDFASKLQSAEEFASATMESFIERSARMEWMTKIQFHVAHPDLGAHQETNKLSLKLSWQLIGQR